MTRLTALTQLIHHLSVQLVPLVCACRELVYSLLFHLGKSDSRDNWVARHHLVDLMADNVPAGFRDVIGHLFLVCFILLGFHSLYHGQ